MDLTGSVVIAEATEKLRKVQIHPPFQVDCEEVSGVKVTPKGRLLEGPALGLASLGVIKFWTAASSVSLGLRQKALSWSLVLGDFSAGDRDQEHCVLTALEFQPACLRCPIGGLCFVVQGCYPATWQLTHFSFRNIQVPRGLLPQHQGVSEEGSVQWVSVRTVHPVSGESVGD